MFHVAQWSGVTFFEQVDVGGDKDFSVTSGEETGSLAATGSERDSVASLISPPLPPHCVPGSPHNIHSLVRAHSPSRGSCQKRQKIFDYAQESHSLTTKVAPRLEDLGPETPTDLKISTGQPATQ